MANELKYGIQFSFAKGSLSESQQFLNQLVTIAGSRPELGHVQQIGITREALDVADVTTGGASCGYICIRNLDTTNFVTLFPNGTDAAMVKILPGKMAFFQLATNTPNAVADTAVCDVQYWLFPA